MGLLFLMMLLGVLPAAAQTGPGPSGKFSGFLCQIDLSGSILGGGTYDFTGFTKQADMDGIIYTLRSSKLCTNSQSNENVKLDCTKKITDWTGPAVGPIKVTCQVGGAACGIAGDLLTAVNNQLSIDAAGNATLTCQVK